VLEAVEAGGLRSTGRCLPLRAFENGVYEVSWTTSGASS